MTVSWDASPTAARYEVKLLQTAPTAKVAVTAIVEDDGGDSFTKTFSNLTPGRYSVSVDRECGGRGASRAESGQCLCLGLLRVHERNGRVRLPTRYLVRQGLMPVP